MSKAKELIEMLDEANVHDDKELLKEFSARQRKLKSKEEADKLLADVDKAADAGKISYKTASNYLHVISSKWDEPLSITPP